MARGSGRNNPEKIRCLTKKSSNTVLLPASLPKDCKVTFNPINIGSQYTTINDIKPYQ